MLHVDAVALFPPSLTPGPDAAGVSGASAAADVKAQKKQTENEFAVLEALRPARNGTPHWVVNVRAIDSQNHHKFQIIITGPSERTKAGRMICNERYSRLLGLHRECSSHHPRVTPTNFPKKKVLGRMHNKVSVSTVPLATSMNLPEDAGALGCFASPPTSVLSNSTLYIIDAAFALNADDVIA